MTLAGGWIVNGLGKLVDGVELTCDLVAQVSVSYTHLRAHET